MKPTTSTDVEVLLSEALNTTKLDSYVDIFKEKGKPTVLVKPKRRIPRSIWSQINTKIHEWNGTWRRSQQLWEVFLE